MTSSAARIDVLHPTLREVFRQFGGTLAPDHHRANAIAFTTHSNEWMFASIRRGDSRVRIRAYFDLDVGPETNAGVEAWVLRQPNPATGVIEADWQQDESSEDEILAPRLVFERPIDGFDTRGIAEDIRAFADAWHDDGIAVVPGNVASHRGDPIQQRPRNAWLLIGSEQSYPTENELRESRLYGDVGVLNGDWTAPKNGELGDLAILYFVAPRKAACFVARLASRPYFDNEGDPISDLDFDPVQWWANLTPLIEIEPITFAQLKESNHGNLMLRGKGGKYLSPEAVTRLTFVARNAEDQELVNKITAAPIGPAELPARDTIDFAVWKQIPAGLLPIEAYVEDYIVEPLIRLVNGTEAHASLTALTAIRQYRLAKGIADFVIARADVPLAVIEAKLAIRRPSDGDWGNSADFRQLRRYMDELDVPGLLVDATSVLLVRPNSDAPRVSFDRATATSENIDEVADHIAGERHSGTLGVPLAD